VQPLGVGKNLEKKGEWSGERKIRRVGDVLGIM